MSISRSKRLFLAWVLLRFPLAGLLLYLFRQDLLEWMEEMMGVGSVTERAIALISTWPERLCLAGISAVVLAGSWAGAQRLRSPQLRYAVPLAIAGLFFLLLFSTFSSRFTSLLALGLTALLALNTLPGAGRLKHGPFHLQPRLIALGFGLLPGLGEGLLPRPFVLWLLAIWPAAGLAGRDRRSPGFCRSPGLYLLPIATVSLMAALALNTPALIEWGHRLHADPAVQILDRGDINQLALSRDRHWLYATGHGLKHLLAYNLDRPDQPPRPSIPPSDYAQGFAYDPGANRLYLYWKARQRLLVLDGTSLDLLTTIPTPPWPPVMPGLPGIPSPRPSASPRRLTKRSVSPLSSLIPKRPRSSIPAISARAMSSAVRISPVFT